MKVLLVVITTLVTLTLSEPPVSQYLPPSNQYGAPSTGGPTTRFGSQPSAVNRPSNQYGAPGFGGYSDGGPGGYARTGGDYNEGYDYNSQPANYNFEYQVQDAASGNDFGHQEARQGDVAQGRYYVLLPDGRRQTVDYIADNEGYKPNIRYEQTNARFGGGYAGGGYPYAGAAGGEGYSY